MLHIRINLSAFISPAWGNCKNRFMRFYGNNKNFVLHHSPTKQWVIFSQHSQGSTIVTRLTVFTQGAGVMDWQNDLFFDLFQHQALISLWLKVGGLIRVRVFWSDRNDSSLCLTAFCCWVLLVYLVLHPLILQYCNNVLPRDEAVSFLSFFCGYLIAWQSCQPTLCAMHKHCKSIYSLTALDWRLVLKPETFTDALIHFRGRQQNHLLAVNLL